MKSLPRPWYFLKASVCLAVATAARTCTEAILRLLGARAALERCWRRCIPEACIMEACTTLARA